MTGSGSKEQRKGIARRRWLFGGLFGLMGLAGGYTSSRLMFRPVQSRPEIPGFLWPDPKRLAAFDLDGTDGEKMDVSRLGGRWTFLFFGYTFCPDVCPTTLMVMADAMKLIRESRTDDDVQMIFVSVDPGRDTLGRIKSYVEYFDTTFIGATASLDRLSGLTRQLGILDYWGKPDENGNYVVDHSASIVLIDPQVRRVGVFSTPHVSEDIAAWFQAMRSFLDGQS